MAHSSEISAKLGLDTNSFKEGLANAKQHFKKFGEDVAHDSEGHGHNIGDQFIHGIKHKLAGAHELSHAVATALGLNIENIAEKIASVITGGSAEEWKKVGDIQEEIAKMLEKHDEKRKSDLQKQADLEKEITRLQNERLSAKPETGISAVLRRGREHSGETLVDSIKAVNRGDVSSSAEDRAKDAEIQKKILESQEKLEESKEHQKKTEEEIRRASVAEEIAGATEAEKINLLLKEKVRLMQASQDKKASQDELRDNRKALEENAKAIADWSKKQREDNKKAADEDHERLVKRREFVEGELSGDEKLKMLREDLLDITKRITDAKKSDVDYQDLLNKKEEAGLRIVKEVYAQKKAKMEKQQADATAKNSEDDKSKLGLNELANLTAFTAGASTTAGNESGTAREALALRAKAEEARKMGNGDEAAELSGKAQQMVNGLQSVRSSEKTQASELKQALATSEEFLKDIKAAVNGKFKAQG